MADSKLLVDARAAVAAGQRNLARGLLVQIVRADQSNGEAWHLLGQVLDDPAQKAECAQRAKAAGYEPQARRIVFPVDEVAEQAPPAEQAGPVTPSPSPAPRISPVAAQDMDSLRASVTPITPEPPVQAETSRRRPVWFFPIIAIAMLVLIIVVVMFVIQ